MNENFYIDNWLVQPDLNRISLNGEDWKLEPKIMQVLCSLAATPGKVVTRDYLFDTVWENTVVVDMVLTRAISELRSIFKDSPTSPKVIETIPKGGYRIIAQITNVSEPTKPSVKALEANSPHNTRLVVALTAIVIITLIAILAAKDTSEPILKSYNTLPLTSLKGWEYEPDISNDAKSVVFLWRDPANGGNKICSKTLGSSDHKVLTSEAGMYFSPKWSPNGDQIAFYSNDKGAVSIKLMPAYGGSQREIIKSKSLVAALSWSPDGEEIAYVDRDTLTNQHAIFLYSLETGEFNRVTSPPENHWGDSSPKFSKDGKQITFIRTLDEGIQDLYSIDLLSQSLERITELKSNIYGFDWDNRSGIVLSTDFDGQVALWKLDSSTEQKFWKLPLGKDKRNPSIAGANLIMEEWNTDTDLWRLDLTDTLSSPKPLVQSTLWDLNPDISTNGKKIAFSSNQSGSYEIWSANSDGKHLKKLTDIKKSLTGNPDWSPKGDMLTFDSQMDGYSHIYLVDSLGNDQYQFTRGKHNNIAPSWSVKGDLIYFASDRSGSWELWKKPTNGDYPVQVTQHGGFFGRESSDGSSVFFTKKQQNGLWSLDLNSGVERMIIKDLNFEDWGNWEVDQTGIYYIARPAQLRGVELHHFNIKKGITDLNFHIKAYPPMQDPTFAIAPNGNWAIFGRINGFTGDLVYTTDL